MPNERRTALAFLLVAAALGACAESGFQGNAGKMGGAKDKGGGKDDGDDASDDVDSESTSGDGADGVQNSEDLAVQVVQTPKFALLVNNLECGMCHTTINGDVVSTAPVGNWSSIHGGMYNEKVNGRWLAAETWSKKTQFGMDMALDVSDGVKESYDGDEMPNDLDKDGKPDFPMLNFKGMADEMRGSLKADGVDVAKVHGDNLVVKGTPDDPIEIDRDILVEGDLVITGTYVGKGTIYVTGNIYIPFDLLAKSTPFPFPQDREAALEKGRSAKNEGDALGLAAKGSIIVGDLTTSLYDMPIVPAAARRAAMNVDHVYSWYPGGKSGYAGLYGKAINCRSGKADVSGSFNRVDAYLYTPNVVAGIRRDGSYVINGGIIANFWHILGEAASPLGTCPGGTNSVHGMPMNRNFINYDYRMQAGLQILEQLAPYFE